MADNILQLPEYDGMKIYPVEIINELVYMNWASEHVLSDASLKSHDKEDRESAQQALKEQYQYLRDEDFSPEDCDTLIEVVKKYNTMKFYSSNDAVTGVTLFVVSLVLTVFLTCLNYSISSNCNHVNRMWNLLIVANIVTLFCVPIFLYITIKSTRTGSKIKREQFSDCRDVARIDEIKRLANYLVSHHNYDAEALSFYLCQYQLEDVDIVIILKQLGLSLTEEKRK